MREKMTKKEIKIELFAIIYAYKKQVERYEAYIESNQYWGEDAEHHKGWDIGRKELYGDVAERLQKLLDEC